MSTTFDPLVLPVQGSRLLSRSDLARVDPEAARENARFYAVTTTFEARYAAAGWAEIFAELPYRVSIDRVAVAGAHHRDETFQGLGDARIGAHVFPWSAKGSSLGVTVGVALPTGRRHRLPGALAFVDEDEAARIGVHVPEHSHLQLGTGAAAPFAGADVLFRLAPQQFFYASCEVTVPAYASDGYQTAPSGFIELGPLFRFGHAVLLGLFDEMYASGVDHFHGQPVATKQGTLPGGFRVPNTGRASLAFAPTVTWWPTRALSLVLRLRVPVVTHADQFQVFAHGNGGNVQLAEPLGVQLGVAYDFRAGRAGSP